MVDIYKQHKAAFKHVSAYVILSGGERVATIAFKFPRDGAGRLYAYVHWLGLEMVRGFAGGYGYDKCSAACEDAIGVALRKGLLRSTKPQGASLSEMDKANFTQALGYIGGSTWDARLRDAGFTVLQAV